MSTLESLALTYLTALRKQSALANTTDELSYRDFLGAFLRGAKDLLGKTAEFTGEAKKITFGRPDYEVTNGAKVIGYVEAEALNTPLTQLKGHAKEQNERFRLNLHNFLLTNHLEFRLFLDGQLVKTARLPEPPESGAITTSPAALDELRELLEQFLDASTPAANTPEDIARALARRARFLRVAADAMLSQDESPLHVYWELYKQTLFDGIDKEKFADVYAQTFTYGLFLAWLNTSGMMFDRDIALHAIPRAVPPIRTLMQFSEFGSLPDEFHWIVDGICSDLEASSRETATKHKAAFDDPLVHFYEPFLAAYNPGLRERAGVYYTPDPVVDFIVRAVDDTLKRDFDKAEGLADSSVRLLDPATGTATFLARAYRQAYETMQAGENSAYWPDRARNHLAKRFYGFERLPTAYTLAHIKLRQLLSELNAPLPDNERLPIYLADTMINKAPDQINLPGADVLSKEIREAVKVRDQGNILVVLGNPPYFGKSDNPSKDAKGVYTYIGRMIQDYYTVDGQPLGEKNPKWLQNDYVKFIRFAQHQIECSGQGIVAFITDNSYLDNPTFRGMRRSLMRTFDEIYLLDLHGNSKKKERALDGGKDENVFDITQGVAIAVFIKNASPSAIPTSIKKSESQILHSDWYGTRKHKYDALRAADLQSIDWQELTPNAPFYLFRPQEQELREEYERGYSITNIFPVNALGANSHRDGFAIAFHNEELTARITNFIAAATDEECYSKFELSDNRDWNLPTARITLKQTPDWQKDVIACLYRPFDVRECLLSEAVMDYPRLNINRHMRSANLSLITTRQTKEPFAALASKLVCGQHKIVSVYDGSFVFPLWQYPVEGSLEAGEERRANLNPAFMEALAERVGTAPTPEAVFHYAYAVFHAPTYRTRYAPFLKIDFPRLPLPPDAYVFHELAALGERLVGLHLLESPDLTPTRIAYPVGGDHLVEKRNAAKRYTPPTADGKPGRVWLNAVEFFDNVHPDVWEFRVGGYQPAFKWLDDRAGRVLTEDDITHYRRMLAALRETLMLLPRVDAAFARLLPTAP